MKVAMLTPCYWPEVRRGTERMVHEVSTELARRGHAATIVTSHPGPPSRTREDGVEVVRVPRPPDGRLQRRWLEDHLTHLPLSYAVVRARRPDVAHAWFTTDALVAARAGVPSVHSHMGLIDHAGLMWKRKRLAITLQAIERADVTVALSRAARDGFARWLGVETPVIPPPVDVGTFVPGTERTEDPTVVCAAAPGEPRKRVRLLAEAWPIVRRSRPRARLLLDRGAELPGDGIETVDMGDRGVLAGLYASAWASALPSVHEAFGLVLAEGLACGTPGVGTRADGIPEVLDRPGIGALFDGDDPATVARAVLEALELAEDPATRERCRARALELSTESCADAYEALYRDLLAR